MNRTAGVIRVISLERAGCSRATSPIPGTRTPRVLFHEPNPGICLLTVTNGVALLSIQEEVGSFPSLSKDLSEIRASGDSNGIE